MRNKIKKFRSDGSWPRQSILNIEFMTNNELKKTLKNGANPNKKRRMANNKLGGSVLHMANTARKTQILLNFGADPNITDFLGRTPIHSSNLDKTKILLKGGADPNAQDIDGLTPLQYAGNSPEKTKLLLETGADPNIGDKVNHRPLHDTRSLKQTKLLIEAGADVNIRNWYKSTPIYYSDSPEKTKLLIECDANVNVQNNFGRTPLHTSRNIEQIKLLLDAGCGVNIKDACNNTALYYFVSYPFYSNDEIKKKVDENFYKIIELFIKEGAEVTQDIINYYLEFKTKEKNEHLLKCMLMKKINWTNAICSFQNLYRNRLMNPDHPFCKRKLEEDFADFENHFLSRKEV